MICSFYFRAAEHKIVLVRYLTCRWDTKQQKKQTQVFSTVEVVPMHVLVSYLSLCQPAHTVSEAVWILLILQRIGHLVPSTLSHLQHMAVLTYLLMPVAPSGA